MFMLEVVVKDADSCTTIGETYKFSSVQRAADYIYLVEGESIPAADRFAFQMAAPSEKEIVELKKTKNYFLWEVPLEKDSTVTYALSYINPLTRARREKACFPQPSKWYHRNVG